MFCVRAATGVVPTPHHPLLTRPFALVLPGQPEQEQAASAARRRRGLELTWRGVLCLPFLSIRIMRCSMARAALPGLLLLAACCSCAAVAAPRRTSLSPLVRYFVYDPNDFLVHRCCSAALASQYLDDQYSQDALFLRELNRSSSFVSPAQLHSRELRDIHAHILPAGVPSPAAQADVFILPLQIMFLTKWGWDTACQASCLPATRNDALADVFARLVHVTPGFRDHFWMTADLDGWNMLSPRPYDVKTRLSAGLTYSVPRECVLPTPHPNNFSKHSGADACPVGGLRIQVVLQHRLGLHLPVRRR